MFPKIHKLFTITYPQDRIDRTEAILRCISKHLSGKPECRGITYTVEIMDTLIDLDVVVRFCRHTNPSRSFMEPAIWHIIHEHFSELDICPSCRPSKTRVDIRRGMLVPGVYKYCYSATHKYRKWFKVEGGE